MPYKQGEYFDIYLRRDNIYTLKYHSESEQRVDTPVTWLFFNDIAAHDWRNWFKYIACIYR